MKLHVYALTSVQPGAVLTNLAILGGPGGAGMTTTAAVMVEAAPNTPTPMPTPTYTPAPQCPSQRVLQVDSGSSSSYTDSLGYAWLPDQQYHPGSNTWGYIGTSAVYTTSGKSTALAIRRSTRPSAGG